MQENTEANMNYLGEIIVFLAVLVGIKGGTWDKNKKGNCSPPSTGMTIQHSRPDF
jgi:hypothetical protein